MDDRVLNFEGAKITFHHSVFPGSKTGIHYPADLRYCVGQLIYFLLEIPVRRESLEQIKISHPPRSPASSNLLRCFMRQISSTLDVKASVSPVQEKVNVDANVQGTENTVWFSCLLQSSHQPDGKPVGFKTEPFLRDGKIYTIPFQIRLLNIPHHCDSADLIVDIRHGQRLGPGWLSSPTRTDQILFGSGDSGGAKRMKQRLKVIHPPELKFQHRSVAGKQLLLLQVSNNTSHPVNIEDCSVSPEVCPVKVCKQTSEPQSDGIRKPCLIHGNMVKLLNCESSVMPTRLLPDEELSLMYNFHLIGGTDYLTKEEITFLGHLRWGIPGSSGQLDVHTAYSLPTIKIKQAHFVMSASCLGGDIHSGDSFTVNYSVSNKLQDFLSVKLYWGPSVSGGSLEEEKTLQDLKQGLLCCDPQVQLGECPYGSVMQAQVRFQALRPGLYEVCKHMKINLRYLIPGEGEILPSPASQKSSLSGEEKFTSEEIWRERSGSGSSFKEPEGPVAAERRLSLANKSYSVGDLVDKIQSPKSPKPKPTEGRKLFLGLEKQGSKYEQMLLNPGNFLKNSCEIFVTSTTHSKQHAMDSEA